MTLYKMLDGERVKMSSQEEAEIQAEWDTYEAARPQREADEEKEKKIAKEMDAVLRAQAIANLESRDEI